MIVLLLALVFLRDPAQVTAFKKANMCPSTGLYGDKPCPGYVVNHVKPLCLGGKDAPENMEYQEVKASYKSDVLERAACDWKKKYDALKAKCGVP